MARFPKHQVTDLQRKQIKAMAAMGLGHVAISRLVELNRNTLYKYYRRELDIGADEANLAVARSLFDMATKEHVPAAAIFWMKARAGWKDRDPDPHEPPPPAIHFTWAPATPALPNNAESDRTIDGTAEEAANSRTATTVSWAK